jgi:hypothetical protein
LRPWPCRVPATSAPAWLSGPVYEYARYEQGPPAETRAKLRLTAWGQTTSRPWGSLLQGRLFDELDARPMPRELWSDEQLVQRSGRQGPGVSIQWGRRMRRPRRTAWIRYRRWGAPLPRTCGRFKRSCMARCGKQLPSAPRARSERRLRRRRPGPRPFCGDSSRGSAVAGAFRPL